MTLKITTLIENQPDEAGALAFEHGLSLYIEFAGKRLLFDTGQTGAFVDNARKLSVDLATLDAVVLSHGHYDHSGGFARLLPLLPANVPVYVGEGFFTPTACERPRLCGRRLLYAQIQKNSRRLFPVQRKSLPPGNFRALPGPPDRAWLRCGQTGA